MRILKTLLRYIFGAAMIAIGITHFTNEAMFLKIVPDYIPQELHRPAVLVSGAAEILLGQLLIVPWTSRLAGWGLICAVRGGVSGQYLSVPASGSDARREPDDAPDPPADPGVVDCLRLVVHASEQATRAGADGCCHRLSCAISRE